VVLADSDPRFAGGRGGKIAQMAAAAEHQRSIPPSLVIGRLIDKGVSAGDVKKLQSTGYGTWLAVDTASKRELLKVKGLPEVRIDKIKVSAGLCWPSDEACTELLRQNSKSYKQLQVEEDRGMAGHKLQLSTADEMLERFPHLAKLFFIYHAFGDDITFPVWPLKPTALTGWHFANGDLANIGQLNPGNPG
jgi:hypothetical protein